LTFRQKYLFSAGVYGRDPEVSVVTDLRAAAALSRAAAGVMKSGVGDAMAELLELAAKDLEICDAQNSRAPDNDGKTRIMPQVWTKHAVELARALLVVKE
jgi:hypothetical protein